MTINVPNFFKYKIVVDGQKIGEIGAPCKKVAILTWKTFGLSILFPNAKIKFWKINFKKPLDKSSKM